MKERTLIRVMTGLCALLAGISLAWAVWFFRRGALLSCGMNVGAFALLLAGAAYGVYWLNENRRN